VQELRRSGGCGGSCGCSARVFDYKTGQEAGDLLDRTESRLWPQVVVGLPVLRNVFISRSLKMLLCL